MRAILLSMGLWYIPGVMAQTAIRVELGDFRFRPDTIVVAPGAAVELTLRNTDTVTPHDFVLAIPGAGVDLKVEVPAGETVKAGFTAPTTPGSWPFYCSKRFLFFRSHRDRGMEGVLIVRPPQQP